MLQNKRIIFLGNLEEGLLSLSRLIREGYNVQICLGDKRSDVLKEYCETHNLHYADGKIVKGNDFLEMLNIYKPDLLVSNNFLYLLPEQVLKNYKAINLHSSLLPDYKGRTPVIQCILEGKQKTGYTIHYMSPEMDCGNILLQRKIPLSGQETSVDIMRTMISYQPSDIIKATELALEGFEGIPMKSGRSIDVEQYREIRIGIDTVEECTRKLKAFVKPYALPYINLDRQKFFVIEGTCSMNVDTKGDVVTLRLKNGYLNLLKISIHGEIQFNAMNFIKEIGIELPERGR
ncbi:formyltransferase family protein [Candidatus Kuenenia sp.]|uniref:formyltransferase family protein n=1 Tax=Candidatus Kuenenia sp. TaxID=2499824 RepID=UPI00322091AC